MLKPMSRVRVRMLKTALDFISEHFPEHPSVRLQHTFSRERKEKGERIHEKGEM